MQLSTRVLIYLWAFIKNLLDFLACLFELVVISLCAFRADWHKLVYCLGYYLISTELACKVSRLVKLIWCFGSNGWVSLICIDFHLAHEQTLRFSTHAWTVSHFIFDSAQVLIQSQVCLWQEKVTHSESMMDLQIKLLVNVYGCPKSFYWLSVHLTLLISYGKLIPREHILGAQLLFKVAISWTVFVKRVLEHDRAFIYFLRSLTYHLINAYTFQRS